MPPTPKELRELVEEKYGKKTLHLCDGYLVLGRDLKLYRWSDALEDIFGISEEKILSENSAGDRLYSVNDFLPSFMSRPEHNLKMLGVFDELEATVKAKAEYGTKEMGAKGGKARKVPAKTADGKDIEVWITLGPLFYEPESKWFFVGFVRKETGTNKIEPQEAEEAKEVVKEALPLIVKQVDQGTNLFGRKFREIFEFIEENVFGFLPEKLRGTASFFTTLALLYAAFLIGWHYLGPKPELRNYNIERPAERPTVPSSSFDGNDRPR